MIPHVSVTTHPFETSFEELPGFNGITIPFVFVELSETSFDTPLIVVSIGIETVGPSKFTSLGIGFCFLQTWHSPE